MLYPGIHSQAGRDFQQFKHAIQGNGHLCATAPVFQHHISVHHPFLLNPFHPYSMPSRPVVSIAQIPRQHHLVSTPVVASTAAAAHSPAPPRLYESVGTKKRTESIFRPWIDESNDRSAKETSTSSPTTSPRTTAGEAAITTAATTTTPPGTRRCATTNANVEPVQLDASTSQLANLELLATNLGKSIAGHRCIYCGKLYSRKYGLKIHLRTHTGFKPLQCKVCKRAFGDPSNLNKHTRLHVEANQQQQNIFSVDHHVNASSPLYYKCDRCDKLLMRKRDLDRHMQTRHPNGGTDIEDTTEEIIL